jgi:hypothetical protein
MTRELLTIAIFASCLRSQSLPTTTPKSSRNAAEVKQFAEALQKKPSATLRSAKDGVAQSEKIRSDFQSLERKSLDEEFHAAAVITPGGPNLPDPWSMLAGALIDKVSGGAQWKGIQLITVPTDAAWNDATYGNYRAWRVLGDSMPAWGPSYRATAETVDSGYRVFIDNLDITPPDPHLQAKADKARGKYNNAVDALSNEEVKGFDRWADFNSKQAALPPANRMSYDDWFAKFEAPKLSALQGQADLAAQAWTSLLNQAGGGYAFAANLLIDYNNVAYQGQAASSADGSNTKKAFYRNFRSIPI